MHHVLRSYLEPQGHTMVILSILTRSGNYQDEISFIVKSGFQTVQKKVLIDVGVQIMIWMILLRNWNIITKVTTQKSFFPSVIKAFGQ